MRCTEEPHAIEQSGAAARIPANLTRDEAVARAGRVSEVAYVLSLVLTEKSSSYRAKVLLDFVVAKGGEGLDLDFSGRKLERVLVNRTEVPQGSGRQGRITLPGSLLRTGSNTVEIEYENDFDNDGAGLHKSIDPADGNEYFYGQFEPFDANRVFPCFDQPDLKATYRLEVEAPPHWEVLANAPELSAFDKDGRRFHRFAPTERFSTYVFGIAAGPYARWNDPAARIPSRIFAPQSLAAYVDHAEIFEVTRQGFDFFEKYFGIAYPFHKYDQIFVPQFNWGAMENVGCVCFNDAYLFRHQPTETERERRANTILHEMAHMWFGNLVTMEWWNDLWLNESFATYMAYLALVKATRFQRAWESFFRGTKSWAYWQDQLPSTHPIETPVPDTQATHTHFDGITYGKGASALKQLAFYLGEKAFQRGVASYLDTFRWGNARREDFLDSLGKAARKDLGKWTRLWLQTSGVNSITPELEVKDGKIRKFQLVQEPGNGDGTLRPHRLEVALYKRGKAGLKVSKVVDVMVEGARTRVPALEGVPAPDFVHANHGDQAYTKLRLDPASLQFALDHLSELPDSFLRSVVWQTVWFMVRDAQARPTVLTDLFLRHGDREDDARVLKPVVGYLSTTLRRYLPEGLRAEVSAHLYEKAWSRLREVEPGSDLQKEWFPVFVDTTVAGEPTDRLVRMLEGGEFVRGLEMDQDKRWSLVTRLAGLGHARAKGLIEEERARDKTEMGRRAAMTATVALPDPAGKHAAWDRFVNDVDEPLDLMRAGMRGFWWTSQMDLLEPYVERFFEAVPQCEKGRGSYFVDAFVNLLYPGVAVGKKTLARGEQVLKRHKKLPHTIQRLLAEGNDEMRRAIEARNTL